MTSNSTFSALPAVTISDQTLEEGWKATDGWQGLIPGISSLDEAVKLLGPSSNRSELSNGIIYDFQTGFIRITILEGEEKIARIWVSAAASQPFTVPDCADTAAKQFGNLIVRSVNHQSGVIMERPGMRICCDPMTENLRIKWMEIFD
jgi:hypothetical protein